MSNVRFAASRLKKDCAFATVSTNGVGEDRVSARISFDERFSDSAMILFGGVSALIFVLQSDAALAFGLIATSTGNSPQSSSSLQTRRGDFVNGLLN
jgi:hypothetical protein